MKITKTRWMHVLGRPGGMRKAAGGRFEGGYRSAKFDCDDVACIGNSGSGMRTQDWASEIPDWASETQDEA